MSNYQNARNYFLQTDERCRVWELKGIKWVLHHKDPSWRHNDVERYNQWNIEDLIPMTWKAHSCIHNTGKKFSEEYRKHLRENHANVKGENNPNYGKPLPEWQKKRISEANTGRRHSEEVKKKMSESHKGNTASKGMHWYNNGVSQTQAYDCPEGFVPGRLPFSNETRKRMSESRKKLTK